MPAIIPKVPNKALPSKAKANINVQDMQLMEADLEDVFMSLVGSK